MEISLLGEGLRIRSLVAPLLSEIAGAWASVALFIAGFAAFIGFLGRAKLALVRYGRSRSAISLPACNCSTSSDDDDDDDDDDDGSDTESLSDDDEVENDEVPSSSLSDQYQSVSGNYGEDWDRDGGLEMAMSGAVVRTWEGLGLGFDRSGGLISIMDLDRGEVLRSFLVLDPAAAASLASPAVVVSAAEGATAVRVWDARASGQRIPAAAAESRFVRRRRVVGIAAGEGKVYVGDDDGVITATDLRRGPAPLVVEAWRERRWPVLPSPE